MLKYTCILLSLAMVGCGTADGRKDPAKVAMEAELAQVEEMQSASDETLSSFSVSGYTAGGKKQWDLEGSSADVMEQDIKLNEVKGKVYGDSTNMTIVADEGILNKTDNNVHLEKNVKATTDDGAVMTTDYLDWDSQSQKLSSDAPVQIERGTMKAQGTGLVGQPTLSKVELKENVTVELALNNDGPPETITISKEELAAQGPTKILKSAAAAAASTVITCDGPLEVDYQKNIAVFNNNVKVNDQRGKIIANRMDVYFATEKDNAEAKKDKDKDKGMQGMEGLGIDKIICIGNVEIHRGENITYSEKAVYDTLSGLLTLTGSPKLVIYSTQGMGEMLGASSEQKKQ
ncbi:MAG: LPS export ABC transporter periplasmic protein LptC [Candidatus Omnitrophota bacterium]